MPKYWKSKDFKVLNDTWQKKIKDLGFKDIELNAPYRRIRGSSRNNLLDMRDFFMALDHYLTTNEDVNKRDREILELFSQGIYIKGSNSIVSKTGFCDKTIRNVIKKYKFIILGK